MGDKEDIDEEVNQKLWMLITGDLIKLLDWVIEILGVVTDKLDKDFTNEFVKLESQLAEALLSYLHLVNAEMANRLRSDLEKDDVHFNSMMILYAAKRRGNLRIHLERIRQHFTDLEKDDSSLYEQKFLDGMADSIVLIKTDLLVSQPMKTNKEIDIDGRKLVVDLLRLSHIILPILEELNPFYSNHVQQFGDEDLKHAKESEEFLLPCLSDLIETLIEYLHRFKQLQKLDENLYKFHKLTNRQASLRVPNRLVNEKVLENRRNVVRLLGNLRKNLSNATDIYQERWSKLLVQLLQAVKNDIRTASSSPPPSSAEDDSSLALESPAYDSSPSLESPEDDSSSSPERRQKGIPQKGSPIKRASIRRSHKCSDGELLKMADYTPDEKFLDIDIPEMSNTSVTPDFEAALQQVDIPNDCSLFGLSNQANQAGEFVEPSEAGATPPTTTSAVASQEPRNSSRTC
ncbi:hypothetical protein C5167_037438 [Papaver somniferum]|uniref:Uncharacterized protein n=1 Tax=Papaver somniferum TaxID=3469 RepID=A0A4Y7I9U4_PAPSO|nr:uncharacterized protein LOC113329049 [Papaver somniferum]RZC44492.1 hypothetical protein C5167_037438 [Papaver somniferum]